MKKVYIFILFAILLGGSGCKKFLEQEPDNRTTVVSAQQINQLLTSAYPKASYFAFTEVMSDNAEDKGQGVLGIDPDMVRINSQSFLFEDVQAIGNDSPEGYWNACYKAIASANQALEVINSKPDSASFKAQKGEALVSRAYAHFMLVTLFSKVYDPATASSDPGIPYVTSPEKVVFGQYERRTVQYVYDMIEKDLNQGIPLIQDQVYGDAAKFHFTQSGAHAFASRFYLFKRDYARVVQEANLVLPNTSTAASSLRPWYPTWVNYQPAVLRLVYTASSEPANILLQETATDWVSGTYYGLRFSLYTDVYDIVLNGPNVTGGTIVVGYRTFGAEPRYYNVPKLFATNGYSTIPLLTMEEVLFNRAEANVMLKNYAATLTDLNAWASRNIRNYNATNNNITQSKVTSFYGASIDESMLDAVLDLKRAFFIHEGMRWLDILRLKIPVVHRTTDSRIVTIGPNDNRRVLQIPSQARLSGIELNPR